MALYLQMKSLSNIMSRTFPFLFLDGHVTLLIYTSTIKQADITLPLTQFYMNKYTCISRPKTDMIQPIIVHPGLHGLAPTPCIHALALYHDVYSLH
jgi:prepilin-type processing-associated H-X9-DG protein